MDSLAAYALIQFFSDIDILLVIFVRFLAFFMLLPVFSGANMPPIVKIGFSFCVSYLIYTSGFVEDITYYPTIIGYISLIATEFFVGVLMAFVVYFMFSIIYFAGQLMDYQIGFSMVSIYDPLTQLQVPIIGNLLYFVVSAFFVRSGGLHSFIYAAALSFKSIPVGGANFGNPSMLSYLVGLFASYISVGFRLAMPVIGSIIIIDVCLGLLVKAVPQMNVFVVGMPLKVLLGLIILFLIAPEFVRYYEVVYDLSAEALGRVIGGMSP